MDKQSYILAIKMYRHRQKEAQVSIDSWKADFIKEHCPFPVGSHVVIDWHGKPFEAEITKAWVDDEGEFHYKIRKFKVNGEPFKFTKQLYQAEVNKMNLK